MQMREDAPHRFFEVIESANAVDPWFKGFDLRTTANLIEKRGLRDDAAIAAIGWCNELQVIDEFIVRFRPSSALWPTKFLRSARADGFLSRQPAPAQRNY